MKKLPGFLFGQAYLKKIEERIYDKTLKLNAQGHKIVGLYCAFTPKELVAAAGGIPVALCSGSESSFPAAEKHLPVNLCPLIKSSYGHAVADTCPYFHLVDFLLADTTCDGKKKMFELLNRIKPVHMLMLPQTGDGSDTIAYWEKEVEKAKAFLEKMIGTKVTDAALKEQIRLYNRLRRTTRKVFERNRGDIPLLYGTEIDAIISSGGFECDIEQRIRDMEQALDDILERAESEAFKAQMEKRPRVLMTGCPTTNKKVLHLIERCGGAVVAMETCGGLKTCDTQVDETGDPLPALARRYLKTACSCMSPNSRRMDLIGGLIREFRVDGVVELTWNACHTYNVEAFQIREAVENRFGTPYFQITTDYSENDIGQLETRVEAFLEVIA